MEKEGGKEGRGGTVGVEPKTWWVQWNRSDMTIHNVKFGCARPQCHNELFVNITATNTKLFTWQRQLRNFHYLLSPCLTSNFRPIKIHWRNFITVTTFIPNSESICSQLTVPLVSTGVQAACGHHQGPPKDHIGRAASNYCKGWKFDGSIDGQIALLFEAAHVIAGTS